MDYKQNIEYAERLLERASAIGLSADKVEGLAKTARVHLDIAKFKRDGV